jgi:hypothetical protein
MTDNKSKIKVSGGVIDMDKKTRNINPDKIRTSAFYLTLNTNCSYKPKVNDEHLDDDISFFDGVINHVLNNIDQFLLIPEGHWSDDYIKDTQVQYFIERGTQKGFLHMHSLIKILHKTQVKLDLKKIREYVSKELGLTGIHIHVRIVRANNEQNILEYLSKYN